MSPSRTRNLGRYMVALWRLIPFCFISSLTNRGTYTRFEVRLTLKADKEATHNSKFKYEIFQNTHRSSWFPVFSNCILTCTCERNLYCVRFRAEHDGTIFRIILAHSVGSIVKNIFLCNFSCLCHTDSTLPKHQAQQPSNAYRSIIFEKA